MNLSTLKFDDLISFRADNKLNNLIYLTDNVSEHRSKSIESALSNKIKKKIEICITNNDSKNLLIDGNKFSVKKLLTDQQPLISSLNIKPKDTLIFDLNSVKLPLLVIVLKLLKESPISKFLFVYGVPTKYSKDKTLSNTSKCQIEDRNFTLTKNCGEFSSIPLSVVNLSDDRVKGGVIIHGFEGDRLNRLFNKSEGILEKDLVGVFQVPAVKAGWENNSYYGNFSAVEEAKSAFRDFYYCAAYDPYQIYDVFCKYRDSYTKSHNEKIFAVPLGPAPTGLGVVLAYLQGVCQGILYDYPESDESKSEGINSVYLYEYHKS